MKFTFVLQLLISSQRKVAMSTFPRIMTCRLTTWCSHCEELVHWSRTGLHPDSSAEFLSLSEPCIPFGELGGNPFWRNPVMSEMLRKRPVGRDPDIARLRRSQRDGDAADDQAGCWKCFPGPFTSRMRKSKDRRNQCAKSATCDSVSGLQSGATQSFRQAFQG